jgi:hypothetical protein
LHGVLTVSEDGQVLSQQIVLLEEVTAFELLLDRSQGFLCVFA